MHACICIYARCVCICLFDCVFFCLLTVLCVCVSSTWVKCFFPTMVCNTEPAFNQALSGHSEQESQNPTYASPRLKFRNAQAFLLAVLRHGFRTRLLWFWRLHRQLIVVKISFCIQGQQWHSTDCFGLGMLFTSFGLTPQFGKRRNLRRKCPEEGFRIQPSL